ncbi:hypothetical protein Tco_0141080 [Tanacetum coccineum]
MLGGLDQLMERKEDGGTKFIWVPLIEYVRTLIMDEAHASSVEVGDKVMLEVSSWKDVVHFGKKEMLAPRYYLADTNLHVHLEEFKVDKTLRFVEEPVEIIDREVKSLKHSRIPIVKSIGTQSEMVNGFGKNQPDLTTMTHEVSKWTIESGSAVSGQLKQREESEVKVAAGRWSPPRNRYIAAETDISLKGGRPPRYRQAIFTTLGGTGFVGSVE